jgi:hypothetical protein
VILLSNQLKWIFTVASTQTISRTHTRSNLSHSHLASSWLQSSRHWLVLPSERQNATQNTPPQTGQFKYIFVRTKIISLLSFVENKIVCFLVQEKERFVFVKKVEYKFFHLLISTCRVVTLKKLVWNKKKLLFFGRDISSEFFLLLRGQGSRKRNKIIARSGGKTISSFVSFYYWENKCCWETFETRYCGFTRRFV